MQDIKLINKHLLFLCTNKEWSKNSKKIIPFIVASRRWWKTWMLNSTKDSWKKLRRHKTSVHGWEDNIVNMSILSKAIYRSNVIAIKFSMVHFSIATKIILKYMCNLKGPWIPKTILRKNKFRRYVLLDLKHSTKLQ